MNQQTQSGSLPSSVWVGTILSIKGPNQTRMEERIHSLPVRLLELGSLSTLALGLGFTPLDPLVLSI